MNFEKTFRNETRKKKFKMKFVKKKNLKMKFEKKNNIQIFTIDQIKKRK